MQDQTLTKLRAELHDITQTDQSKMDLVRIQMEDQITKSEEEHKLASHQLMEKISGLESTIESQSQINRDTEAALRKKKERIEADLATQVSQYDTNMAEMQRQTEEIKLKMAEEKERLRELEEYFAKIDANQKRQSREVAILATFRKRVFLADKFLHNSSTSIQKIVRGKQLRAFIRQMINKKSKKGKGGKKGKKGKK